MTAPAPTVRGTPLGIKLPDGYQALVTFAVDTDISLWEKEVTPPGIDGGEPIDTTTMHNTVWRTTGPRSLSTLTPMTFTAAYDPDVYDEILAIRNVETTVTVTFADGSTLAFYGYLQKFDPGPLAEGTPPEATVTVVPTNYDPVAHTEEGPIMTEVSGT
jgi:hypothetical protein